MSEVWHYRCMRCGAWGFGQGRDNAVDWCRLHRSDFAGSGQEHSTIIWLRGSSSDAAVIGVGIGGDDES